MTAHRDALAMHKGLIPDVLHVFHRCDNTLCTRPEHLFLGTHLENMRDRDSKGRRVAPKGSAHGRSKLSEEDVRGIRKLLVGGASGSKVARQFNVSPSLVSRIKHNQNWSYV